jgi:hypothetical protein
MEHELQSAKGILEHVTDPDGALTVEETENRLTRRPGRRSW